MQLWKVGCGVMILGVVASLGSCGLFGLAINRHLEQRQIASLDLSLETLPAEGNFRIDEVSKLRLVFEARVLPGEADLERADSSSTIVSSQLPLEYRVWDQEGRELDRGAGILSGSQIIPDAHGREGSSLGREIDLSYRGSVFEPLNPGEIHFELILKPRDEEGREVLDARALVFDRVGTNTGGLAAGGLLSMIAGPIVFGAGILLLFVGILLREKRKNAG